MSKSLIRIFTIKKGVGYMARESGIETNFVEIGKRVLNSDQVAQVQIELLRPNSMVLVGSWSNSLDLVETKINSVCGIKPDPLPGNCVTINETIIACLSPGQFLLLSAAEDLYDKLNDLMMPNASTVLDLKHSRIGFRLSGAFATAVLAKGLAVDIAEPNFPVSSAMQTTIDHITTIIIRNNVEVFDLYVPSSFGQSFAHWLTDASLEYGYAIGDFAKVIQLSA